MYRNLLITQEKKLQSANPRNSSHRYIMPALLARVIQLDVNHWLYLQMRTDTPVPMMALTDVFYEIEREKNWEPSFPTRYLQLDGENELPHPTEISLGGGTSTTGASSLTGGTPELKTGETKSTMIRNMTYKDDLFASYKAKGIKSAKLKDALKERKVQAPLNSKGERMCLPYHVLGFCNSRCGHANDHATHTTAEDQDLHAWCGVNYKIE
jgi:hypothetical protein